MEKFWKNNEAMAVLLFLMSAVSLILVLEFNVSAEIVGGALVFALAILATANWISSSKYSEEESIELLDLEKNIVRNEEVVEKEELGVLNDEPKYEEGGGEKISTAEESGSVLKSSTIIEDIKRDESILPPNVERIEPGIKDIQEVPSSIVVNDSASEKPKRSHEKRKGVRSRLKKSVRKKRNPAKAVKKPTTA